MTKYNACFIHKFSNSLESLSTNIFEILLLTQMGQLRDNIYNNFFLIKYV